MHIEFDEIEGTIVDERTAPAGADVETAGDKSDPLAKLRSSLAQIEERLERLRAD